MTKLFFLVAASLCIATGASGDPWDHIGPHDAFDDKDNKGEAGTVASAASSAAQPNIIYAGGSNNGASSGILKTVDGGVHWTRNSNGMWDTHILGTWIHPDDPSSDHVFAGTQSGIYESTDGAASWKLRDETKTWGNVMSFREGVINGEKYIFANSRYGILTMPYEGGAWNRIGMPEGEKMAHNQELSMVMQDGKTEAVMCTGEWKYGGRLYYLDITSPTNGTWTGPILDDCCNVAVDPNDRNHLLFTNATEKRAYESKDAGKTSQKLSTPSAVFFVIIDQKNNFYTATQAGAYVSYNEGKNWSRYQAVFHPRAGGTLTRGAHDFQRIIPYFQGDGIALTSDQGLHIVNGTEQNLTNAVGDMTNCIVLGLSVSPGDQDGPRKLVATMMDWSASASWDDGATWASWDIPEKDIQKPGIGEGGGTRNLGKSGHVLMWHHSTNWYSNNGGKNLTASTGTPGSLHHAHDYLRLKGSRSEPSGTVFSLADVYPDSMDTIDSMDTTESMDTPEDSEEEKTSSGTSKRNVLVSEDFGVTWTAKPLPDSLQNAEQVIVNPDADDLFVVTPNCLAKSTDKGSTWESCSYTPTQDSPDFTALTVISSNVMFLSRGGSVPLRTTDGGHTWTALTSAAPLFKYGASLELSPSWSGKTLVFHGSDYSAISRGAFGSKVWKSTNNGDDWSDETGDIVTISLGHGVWYEKDFYIISAGEGVMVKRNFEA